MQHSDAHCRTHHGRYVQLTIAQLGHGDARRRTEGGSCEQCPRVMIVRLVYGNVYRGITDGRWLQMTVGGLEVGRTTELRADGCLPQ